MNNTGGIRNKTGIIILAAGGSTRLGRPKQLLPYQGTTLIGHIVGEAIAAELDPVVVVTGAFDKEINDAFDNEINDALPGKNIYFTHNPRWREGMGTSIVAGLAGAQARQPDTNSIIIAVCDQPHLSAGLLKTLISTQVSTQKGIVACVYSDTVGTPALFTEPYFGELSALAGDEGAKKILRRYQDGLELIPFPKGAIDIDTPEDYRALVAGEN
jgi:molybdenum cofactor cytidylyltransferase